jgi:hypothetical protein
MSIASETKKGCLGGCLGIGLAIPLFFVAIFAYQMLTRSPEDMARDAAEQEEKALSAAAWGRAKDFVTKSLKSPKTADFPSLDWKSKRLDKSRFLVSSHVDSQNGFGANIRTDFNVILKYKGGPAEDPHSWEVETYNHRP